MKMTAAIRRTLDEAEAARSEVSFIVDLKSSSMKAGFDELAHAVVQRAQEQSGSTPTKLNVFQQLGHIFVQAPAAFCRELFAQPEVAKAAYAPPDDAVTIVRPVRKSRASSTGWAS